MLSFLYRDDDLVIVDKPSGLLVHRGWGDDRVVAITLVRDAVGRHVFPVHRLDRGTSGALMFALSAEVAAALGRVFEEGGVRKGYLALVRGVPPEQGEIDSPVPKDEDGPRVEARTSFTRLHASQECADGRRFSLVLAEPHTGRFHQIRRHLKHLSHPIVGDVNYGRGEINRLFRETYGLRRLALHAWRLTLPHPRTGEAISVTAPVPEELAMAFRALGIPEAAWLMK